MIEFNNYSFYYKKGQPLFKGLNFELEKGKVYGLFGKNGCGKTTLLHSMVGLNFPKEGNIESLGASPKKRDPNYLNQISFLSDNIYIPKMSIKNYMKVYGAYYPNFSENQFYKYLSDFEVPLTNKPEKMSFGQQKKFMIAFVLACNTPLLLMDEPTNGLDISSKKKFRKIVASAISRDTIVIISTHSARDLEKMFDHVLLIDQGELIVNKEVFEITNKLSFNFYDFKPNSQNCLISEQTVGGYQTIEKNNNQEQSNFDMELFFNACISNPKAIKQILNS